MTADARLPVTVVHLEPEDRRAADSLRRDWELWSPGVELVEVDSATRSVGRPLAAYVRGPSRDRPGTRITVLIRRDTDAVICRLRFRLRQQSQCGP